MLFTKIRLAGRTNVDLPFFGLNPLTNRYILKSVDGLGPPEIDVFINNKIYQGRRPQSRQIVARVGLSPNYAIGQTASSMRTTLYGLLTPGASDAITVKLMNGPNVVAVTVGYVKRIEIVPFSKDPEVQITIDCLQPYLSAETLQNLAPTAKDAFTVDNVGSVTTGFYFETIFTADISSWALYSEGPGSGPKMRFTYAFLAGDKLMVDTREDQCSVKLLRGGTTTNLIKALTADSIWFQLHPGVNTFWSSSTGFDWGQTLYTPQYWGI